MANKQSSILKRVEPGLKVGHLTVLRLIPTGRQGSMDVAYRVEALCDCGKIVTHSISCYRDVLTQGRQIGCRVCSDRRSRQTDKSAAEVELVHSVAKRLFARQQRAVAEQGISGKSAEIARQWQEMIPDAIESIAEARRGLPLHLADHTAETKGGGLNPMRLHQYQDGEDKA